MVKRFMVDGWMQTPTGEHVLYSDYAALEKRFFESNKAIAALEARCLLAEKQRDEALSSEGYKDSVLSDCSAFVQGEYAKKDKRIAELEAAIRWACGEVGEFPGVDPSKGRYYWRTELRQRANLPYSAPETK